METGDNQLICGEDDKSAKPVVKPNLGSACFCCHVTNSILQKKLLQKAQIINELHNFLGGLKCIICT